MVSVNLGQKRLDLESQLARAVSNVAVHWHEMQSEAWRFYQSVRAQMLRQPPEGQRQAGAL
jgi:hypothetical protein